jgi:hypothetical protein
MLLKSAYEISISTGKVYFTKHPASESMWFGVSKVIEYCVNSFGNKLTISTANVESSIV